MKFIKIYNNIKNGLKVLYKKYLIIIKQNIHVNYKTKILIVLQWMNNNSKNNNNNNIEKINGMNYMN